jgi:YesN/AraC family two-component response regulator
MIRVLLVDDDALVRSGLRMMLAGAANLDVVAEAATAARCSARSTCTGPTSS